jgi:hypothetical protein
MTTTESLSLKIAMLPPTSQKQVIDLIDELFEKRPLTPTEKAEAWEAWARSHSDNRAIVDDSREAIYED